MHRGMGGMSCPTCGCGAGEGHGMGGMKAMFKIMPWKIMMHAEEIGISDEQLEKLRNRHSEAKKQMIQIHSQIKMNMVDVKSAVMRDQIDMATAEAKIQEIGKLKAEMFLTMVRAMNDMRQMMTPEQHMRIKRMIMGWFKKGGMAGMEMEEEEEGGESEE